MYDQSKTEREREPGAEPHVLVSVSLETLRSERDFENFEVVEIDVQASSMEGLQGEIVEATRLWEGAHHINALLDMLETTSVETPLLLYLRGWEKVAADPRFVWFLLVFEEFALQGRSLYMALEFPQS